MVDLDPRITMYTKDILKTGHCYLSQLTSGYTADTVSAVSFEPTSNEATDLHNHPECPCDKLLSLKRKF